MELLFLSQWVSLPLHISLLPLGAAAVTAAVCAPGVFEPGAAGAEGRPVRVPRAGAPVGLGTAAVTATAAAAPQSLHDAAVAGAAVAVAATAAVGAPEGARVVGVVAFPGHGDCCGYGSL